MDINTLFALIIIVGIVYMLLVHYRQTKEGFENFPKYNPNDIYGPRQAILPLTSANPPKDAPGASTSDPTKSVPQMKDIQATINSLENMRNSFDNAEVTQTTIAALPEDIKKKMGTLGSFPTLMDPLLNALDNPTQSNLSVQKLSDARKLYDELNRAYAGMPRKKTVDTGPSVASAMTDLPKPTTVAGPPGQITMESLKNLRNRIQSELERVKNLRSSSPTLNAKQEQLEKLLADINEMLEKIGRKELELKDVPISETDANAFLKNLSSDVLSSNPIAPKGAAQLYPTVNFSDDSMVNMAIGQNPNIQSLLENTKYLKWNVQVNMEFNPELAQNDRYIKRLEDMETRLTNLVISETPIPKNMYKVYMNELKTIRAIVTKKSDESPNLDLNVKQTIPLSTPDVPSSLQLARAQGQEELVSASASASASPGQGENVFPEKHTIKKGEYRNEYPDFKMRGSSSAFDTSLVGGLDYKERAKNLCQQIEGASIGDPREFGCIKDQNSVSSSYSWKGNFEMVCSRLGNTWGGWYPEMLGCPKPRF